MEGSRVLSCLCLWLLLGRVGASHIPLKMNQTIQKLTQYYKIPVLERFNGKPVFSKENLTGRTEVRKVFMEGVLETYEEMIKKMLEQLPTPSPRTPASPSGAGTEGPEGDSVRDQLNYILHRIHKLKDSHYQEQKQLLTRLASLHKIPTNNIVVQSKALWELPWLYEEASSLVTNTSVVSSRRRRQLRKRRHQARAAA